MSPIGRGALLGAALVGTVALMCWWPLAQIAERPSAELLRYTAAIGATLLVAYAIETAASMRPVPRRTSGRELAVGALVGIAATGAAGIAVALALGERAEVGHWIWVDGLAFAFSVSSLLFLAIMVVLLPLDAYERQASLALASADDPVPREEEISMSNGEAPLDVSRARELLQRERERIEGSLRELGQLRESGLDEADNATNIFDDGEVIEEREVDEALKEQLRAELEAVRRAEKRLEDGAYGFSVESGEPIPAQRLETIPWAERTAEEQQRYERTHGRAL